MGEVAIVTFVDETTLLAMYVGSMKTTPNTYRHVENADNLNACFMGQELLR